MKLKKKAEVSVKGKQNLFGIKIPQVIYIWKNGIAVPAVDNLALLAASICYVNK